MDSIGENSESHASPIFLSPESFGVERIFPIRNLVDEHTDDSGEEAETAIEDVKSDVAEAASSGAPAPEYLPPPFPKVPSADKLRKLPTILSESDYSSHSDGEGGRVRIRKVTERAQLVPEKNGGVPGTTTMEAGKTVFHRCEDEPIHTPGAIQSYGALVALRYADDGDGDVLVRIASENTEAIIGYSPESLFQLDSFCDILDASQKRDFLARMDHVLAAGHMTSPSTDLDVFSLILLTRTQGLQYYWCGLHLSVGTKDTVICEVETQDDSFFPGTPGVHTLPAVPTSTIDNKVVEEERVKSTTRMSQGIRALSLARKRNTRLGYVEMFNSMSQVQSQLSATKTLQGALDVIVGIVQEMTHFHRVMIYRFDQDFNGAVVAELVDPRASEDLFRGLHFPASDIPQQARDLYKINRIRILYDRDSETARLVARDESDFTQPLDLTHSYLRAMSPVHLKYLGNMGVRSSMSISIVINGELWGLVACHSYGEEGIKVPLPIRELCRNIGECASINIERLIMFSRLLARRPLENAAPPQNAPGFIAASSADLLNIFQADFGMLSIQDEARTIGKPAPYREALALLAHLQKKKLSTIVSSQKVTADFPNIKYAPGIHSIAGILVIPLSMLGNDFIVFFRLGHLKEVRWAGNPYEKTIAAGTAKYLEPRSSFRRWTEKVMGTSKEWTDDQLETASILSLVYGRFIEVWRQKELAVQRSRMTRLLLRNSSHEVRTPLNAVINYLEIALENNLDDSTREIIQKAHKSSRSLVYVIDDLLNLTKAEDGSIFTPAEIFGLGATVSEVVSTFKIEARRRGLDLTLSIHPGLPSMVKGDPTRLRQVLSNVISNAFQNSASGGVKVDLSPVRVKQQQYTINITIQDLGSGMSEKQLDDLFQDFEQILDEDEEGERSPKTPADKPALGVGLAVVARYVRNMNGQIKVKSELEKGTIFTIEIPFDRVGVSPLTESTLPYSSGLVTSSAGFTPASTTSEHNEMSPSSFTNSSTPAEGPRPNDESPDTVVPTGELALENFKFAPFVPPPQRSIALTLQQKRAANQSTIFSSPAPATYPFPDMPKDMTIESRRKLKILIAEDNPINARMLKKRLEKTGHEVYVVDDGQSCFDAFQQTVENFDAILMDLQMPLIDGHASARMIRKLEKERETLTGIVAAARHGRIPIFAVSASLTEAQRFEYAQDGFDGWVLKPIDYNRLELLMHGVYVAETRRKSVYSPGEWESGGWFMC